MIILVFAGVLILAAGVAISLSVAAAKSERYSNRSRGIMIFAFLLILGSYGIGFRLDGPVTQYLEAELHLSFNYADPLAMSIWFSIGWLGIWLGKINAKSLLPACRWP